MAKDESATKTEEQTNVSEDKTASTNIAKFNSEDLKSFSEKVKYYHAILNNTQEYREAWEDYLKDKIISLLEQAGQEAGLAYQIDIRSSYENLEAIVFMLPKLKSGIFRKVGEDVTKHLVKNSGALIYQQLFNGKVIVLVEYPYIEQYGKPRKPKTIAIYRPEELRPPYILRHLETMITEITHWEDYDDDEPNKKIGFQLNFAEGEEGVEE